MYQKFLHEREVGKEVTMRPGRAPHLQKPGLSAAVECLCHVTRNETRQELIFFGHISDFLQEEKSLHRNIINQVILLLTAQSNLLKFWGNFNSGYEERGLKIA